MLKQVTASAPGKLLLFGEHSVVHGYPCIVTAVDQRLTVNVRKNGLDVFHLDAPDMGLSAYSKTLADLGKKDLPKAVCFIEMLYKRFLEKYPQKQGIVVTTKSDFSSKFGFGSSSAVTVAFAKALTTLYGIDLDEKELFDICYQAVLDVQGVGSGFDIAAAIWGGTLYYVSPAKVVQRLSLHSLPLVVGYTGIKADTPTLIRMVQNAYASQPEKITHIFEEISEVVEQGKVAMVSGDWHTVGELMKKNQILLNELQVSGVKLDELIQAAETHGGFGAKLSGAGGGDCMITVATEEHQPEVKRAISEAGGNVIEITPDAEGVRVESIEEDTKETTWQVKPQPAPFLTLH
jgi:mevalonate kinase